MNRDRIALKLNGIVPLADYAKAVEHFSKLISALSDEVSGRNVVEWDVVELEAGSALMGVKGFAEDLDHVYRVTSAYAVVGNAIEKQLPIPYSFVVAEEVRMLTSIINGHIKSIEFRAPDSVSTIDKPIFDEEKRERVYSMGSVTGQVDTVSKRRRYTFTLYDLTFDKAVTCYLRADQAELMRDAWGKITTVWGEVQRDAESGRPIEVRNVTFVEIDEAFNTPGYQVASGVLAGLTSPTPSEELVRALRDV